MKNSILVEYKGGGYSGCFWEWNYFLISENEFYNLYSSGYRGIKTFEKAKELFKDWQNDESDSVYVYNLNSQKDVDNFTSNSNPGNIIMVLSKIDALNLAESQDLQVKCPRCNNYHDIDQFLLDPNAYTGDGGIGISYQEFHCEQCESEHSCSYCGEYMSIYDEENCGLMGECPNCEPYSVDEDDYTDDEKEMIETFDKEIAWLSKDWLNWPKDFDREARLTEVKSQLSDYETKLAYLHDDRFIDDIDSLTVNC